jgi:hypothetical protein
VTAADRGPNQTCDALPDPIPYSATHHPPHKDTKQDAYSATHEIPDNGANYEAYQNALDVAHKYVTHDVT